MYTIGELTKRFSISRSTLLYYDSIGLLRPSGRTSSGYRLYSDRDMVRMESIMLYRDSGLPLKSILDILDRRKNQSQKIMENQLSILNDKIGELRDQQSTIIKILGLDSFSSKSRAMTKPQWVSILKAAGLTEEGMKRWHVEFERSSPEGHQDFLESLRINDNEIKEIRRVSANEINNEI